MAISIMRQFSGYTLANIMDMPYCHFLHLYAMAEKAEALQAYTILQGNASLHDKKMIEDLSYVYNSKFVQPKIVFPPKSKG